MLLYCQVASECIWQYQSCSFADNDAKAGGDPDFCLSHISEMCLLEYEIAGDVNSQRLPLLMHLIVVGSQPIIK